MLYASVIVKQRTQVQELTYALSAQIVPYVKVGSLVLVPLRHRSVEGMIVGFSRSVSKEIKRSVREIIKLAKGDGLFSDSQIEVVHRLAAHYAAPLAEVAFHALSFPPQNIPTPKGQSSTEKSEPRRTVLQGGARPIILTGSWVQRCDAYRRILAKSNGRILFIFAQSSHATSFLKYIKASEPSYLIYDISEFGGKKRTSALIGRLREAGRANLIGTLGDIFFPLQAGDTIVVDQPYHVGAKSQSRPFMTSRQIALTRGEVEGLRVVLGDTLISPEDLLFVKEKLFRMATAKPVMQQLTIVDRRGQKTAIAPTILDSITAATKSGKRILVLVMARGWASALVCQECGHVFGCQNCHRTAGVHGQELRCGYCSNAADLPRVCPVCRSAGLKPIGEGVSAVKKYLADHFKSTKVAELSGDQPILEVAAQIIVATEKIFSFPDAKFDTTFIINADRLLSGTHLNGTWRLLGYLFELQSKSKHLIIQTYFPDSIVWSSAATGNVRPFFAQELANRQQLNLPPYGAVISVRGSASSTDKLFEQAEKITTELLKILPKADISYPEVDDHSGGSYHGHFTLYLPKPPQNSLKTKLASLLPPSWHLDID